MWVSRTWWSPLLQSLELGCLVKPRTQAEAPTPASTAHHIEPRADMCHSGTHLKDIVAQAGYSRRSEASCGCLELRARCLASLVSAQKRVSMHQGAMAAEASAGHDGCVVALRLRVLKQETLRRQ